MAIKAPNQNEEPNKAVGQKFEQDEFRPVEQLYERVKDNLDFSDGGREATMNRIFEIANDIKLINADTRQWIDKNLGSHDVLFANDYQEYVSAGVDPKKAFVDTFKDVYRFALYAEEVWSAAEAQELWAANDDEVRDQNHEAQAGQPKYPLQKEIFDKLKRENILAIPLDAFGTSGRSEIQAMFMHLMALKEEEEAAGKSVPHIEALIAELQARKEFYDQLAAGDYQSLNQAAQDFDLSGIVQLSSRYDTSRSIEELLAEAEAEMDAVNYHALATEWGVSRANADLLTVETVDGILHAGASPEVTTLRPVDEINFFAGLCSGDVILSRRALGFEDTENISKSDIESRYQERLALYESFSSNTDSRNAMISLYTAVFGSLNSLTENEINGVAENPATAQRVAALQQFISNRSYLYARTRSLQWALESLTQARGDMGALANQIVPLAQQIIDNDSADDIAKGVAQNYLDAVSAMNFDSASQSELIAFYNGPLQGFLTQTGDNLSNPAIAEAISQSESDLEYAQSFLEGGANVGLASRILEDAFKPSISPAERTRRNQEVVTIEERIGELNKASDYFAQGKFADVVDAASGVGDALEKLKLGENPNFAKEKRKLEAEISALKSRSTGDLRGNSYTKKIDQMLEADADARAFIDKEVASFYEKRILANENSIRAHAAQNGITFQDDADFERQKAYIAGEMAKAQAQSVNPNSTEYKSAFGRIPQDIRDRVEAEYADSQASKIETQSEKIGEKENRLDQFKAIERATQKFYNAMEALMEHLKVASGNGVTFEATTFSEVDGKSKRSTKNLDFTAVNKAFSSLDDESDPTKVFAFFETHIAGLMYQTQSGKRTHVENLITGLNEKVSETKDELKTAKTNLEDADKEIAKVREISDAAAAKRVIAQILRHRKGPDGEEITEAEAADFASTILKGDMRILQSLESAKDMAERDASNLKLETMQDAWIKRTILSFSFEQGKKVFDGFEVADFKDPRRIIEAIDKKRLSMADGSGKSAMLALAGIRLYEEQMGVKFTGTRALEAKLKDIIAKELGEEMYQDTAGSASVVEQVYDEELKEAMRALRSHVGYLDENESKINKAKLEELVAKARNIREQYLENPDKWPKWRRDAEYEFLLDEAKEYGIDAEFAQAAAMHGFNDSVHFVRMNEFFKDAGIWAGKKTGRVFQGAAEAGLKMTGGAAVGAVKGAAHITGGVLDGAWQFAKAPLYMAVKPGYWALNFVSRKQRKPPEVIAQVRKATKVMFKDNVIGLAKGTQNMAVAGVKKGAATTAASMKSNWGKSKFEFRDHEKHSKVDKAYLQLVEDRNAKIVQEKEKVPVSNKPSYDRKPAEAKVVQLRKFRERPGDQQQVKKAA